MERRVEQPIIADTSALVSLATKTDQNHVPATKAAGELSEAQRPIILPSDVLVETVNTLCKRSSPETALKAVDALIKPGSQSILVETTSHVEAALAKFKEQPEAVSLTDSIVMALANRHSTKGRSRARSARAIKGLPPLELG
jgi:predicted nucleic acid-binding protein